MFPVKPIAVISDIHANLEALQAVMAAIGGHGIEDVYCLGDVVGYGPDPAACAEICSERCRVVLAGNHEEGILKSLPARMNPAARESLEWTRAELERNGLVATLAGWPTYHQLGDQLLVHASVQGGTHGYLLERDRSGMSTFDGVARFIEQSFIGYRICYVGHNHLPFLATTAGFIHPHDERMAFFAGNERFYVSVGSVGQPRDGDPRACFVTYDGQEVRFVRVAYDWAATAAKIQRLGLPVTSAERLARGR
jgi:diadenosine tetraphosphatase ApaH/serine/threonine PP2A family protein phosphatase